MKTGCVCRIELLLLAVMVCPGVLGQSAPAVQAVATAQGLQDALASGSRHVVVREHLDLSSLQPVGQPARLLQIQQSTSILQGSCSAAEPNVQGTTPLRTLKPEQCVLQGDHDLVGITGSGSAEGPVFITRVYLRLVSSGREQQIGALLVGGQVSLYMEDVTVQGDGGMEVSQDTWVRGMDMLGRARAHLQGCSMVDLAAWRAPGVALFNSSTVSASACVFDRVAARSGLVNTGALFMVQPLVAVRVVDCLFTNVTPFGVANSAGYGAAYTRGNVSVYARVPRMRMEEAPAQLFASGDDSEFVAIRQEVAEVNIPPVPSTPDASSLPRSSRRRWPLLLAAIMGASAAIIVACMFVLAMLVARYRRQTQRSVPSEDHKEQQHYVPTFHANTTGTHGQSALVSHGSNTAPLRPAAASTREELELAGAHMSATVALVTTESQGNTASAVRARGSPLVRDPSNTATLAPRAAVSHDLQQAPHALIARMLDKMAMQHTLLYGQFQLAGLGAGSRSRERRVLIQRLQNPDKSGEPLAARMFLQQGEFEYERQLYEVEAFREAMPRLHAAKERGWKPAWEDAVALPPSLVTDWGDNLEAFMQKHNNKNKFMKMLALEQALHKLRALHNAGWVHRDLRPRSFIRHPVSCTWSIVNLGRVARAGTRSSVSAGPYCAPEVVRAAQGGSDEMVTDPNTDIWSFGMIAFEVLTDETVASSYSSDRERVDAVLGRTSLPWEDGAKKKALFRKLGVFKRSVMSCLDRDPSLRMSCSELIEVWRELCHSQMNFVRTVT